MSRTDIVIYWILSLFTLALAVNAFGLVTHQYDYTLPVELLEFSRVAVAAALGVQTFKKVRDQLKK